MEEKTNSHVMTKEETEAYLRQAEHLRRNYLEQPVEVNQGPYLAAFHADEFYDDVKSIVDTQSVLLAKYETSHAVNADQKIIINSLVAKIREEAGRYAVHRWGPSVPKEHMIWYGADLVGNIQFRGLRQFFSSEEKHMREISKYNEFVKIYTCAVAYITDQTDPRANTAQALQQSIDHARSVNQDKGFTRTLDEVERSFMTASAVMPRK